MKFATLRICLVVILSFLTARARAQSDTSIYIYIGPVGGSCSYTVIEVNMQNGDTVATWGAGGSISTVIDDTLYSTHSSPSFYIDTAQRMIRNLRWDSAINFNAAFNVGQDAISVTIDSLPYSMSVDGSIHVQGKYEAYEDFGSFRFGGEHNILYSGGCNEKFREMDSVSVGIFPPQTAATQSPVRAMIPYRVRVLNDELIVDFDSSMVNQSLEVFDLMGRPSARVDLVPGQTELRISVAAYAPGCYFARLGNQVAKLLIPPRLGI